MTNTRAEIQGNPVNVAGKVRRFRPEQIAQRSSWNRLADLPTNFAAFVTVSVRPVGSSTITELNPLDPGTSSTPGTEWGPGWLERPCPTPGRLTMHR